MSLAFLCHTTSHGQNALLLANTGIGRGHIICTPILYCVSSQCFHHTQRKVWPSSSQLHSIFISHNSLTKGSACSSNVVQPKKSSLTSVSVFFVHNYTTLFSADKNKNKTIHCTCIG